MPENFVAVLTDLGGTTAPDRILLDNDTPHTASLARILVINHSSSGLADSSAVMVMFVR